MGFFPSYMVVYVCIYLSIHPDPSIHPTFLASLRPFLVRLPINLKSTVRVQSNLPLQNSLIRAFSRDVTSALLVFQNNETAAMLVF